MARPVRRGFLRRFGLKTGLIHFAHFGLESGMVFEGITEKGRKRNMRFLNGLTNLFVCALMIA